MSKTIIRTESDDIEETLVQSNKWLNRELTQQTKRGLARKPADTADINLYAEVRQGDVRSIIEVGQWKAADLYGYSDAPRIGLLNVFDELAGIARQVVDSNEDVEFELKTIDLWQRLKQLNQFFGISGAHDELIATLQSLPAAVHGVLDEQKAVILVECFTKLRDSINVTDEVLDAIEDSLESVDFDLQIPMLTLPTPTEPPPELE